MIRGPKFTYANVMATVAVFISLSGTAYAAAKINGATIKKRSIPANRVKANALTGVEVNEKKLGIVPKATSATASLSTDRLGGSTLAEVIAAAKLAATPACPPGTELLYGVCYETALRAAATYNVAAAACAADGRRLPSQGELTLFTWARTINANERTDQSYYDESAVPAYRATAMYFDGLGNSGAASVAMTSLYAHRCVVLPSIA